LVEVLVALGIAAGALILLVSANNESLRRSIRCRQLMELEELAEARLDEIRLGVIGTADRGRFEGHPELSWAMEKQACNAADLKGLQRLTLSIYKEAPAKVLHKQFVLLQYVETERR
jgi:type II secretory pathway pseudopilin PulG